jgi:hypothetical protein
MGIGALPDLLLSLLKTQGADQLQAAKDAPSSQFKPGGQYDAKVLEALPNGRNLVQIGKQTLDMALPQQAKTGDVLRLTFLNAGPRPTFALNAPATGPTPVSFSQAAQQVNALVRYVAITSPTPVSGTSAAISAAALTATPAAAPAAPLVANPAVLLAPAPASQISAAVLPGAVIPGLSMAGEAVESMRASLGSHSSLVNAQGVAAAKADPSNILPMRLQQTVKESGLFYESHLGKWARGELSLESIQREPQARLAHTPGPLLDLPDLDGMPDQAARLAGRQLNMLEGGPFFWQGQAWPGQVAEWTVSERDNGGGDDAELLGQKWQSRIRLTLPRLGDVAAELDLGAQGLRVRLRSASAETLAEIDAALPELIQRMRSADLNLSSITTGLNDGGG